MAVPVAAIVLPVLAAYAAGYVLYGKKVLQEKIVKADASRKTPAYTRFDGVDYVPANKWVLYGHHFASIAGAGPIIGPALAAVYGWLAPLLWVIFGNLFIGAVHDYLALMASVRHGGISIMSVAEGVMGRKAKYAFLVYVWGALLLVLAAFLSVAATVYANLSPNAATKAVIYMPIALLLGFLMYRAGFGIARSTIVAVVLAVLGYIYSYYVPLYLTYSTWVYVLMLYSFIAAALPVWYLLQPRDYLNAYLLWAFVGASALAAFLILGAPVKQPAVITWVAPAATIGGVGAIGKEPLAPFWPSIVLIIACGSLSGFHSIVASGTTSKQLANELDALLVGYGGMLTEGAVSTLAVITPIAFAWSDAFMGMKPLARWLVGYGEMFGAALGGVVGAQVAAKAASIFAAIALTTFVLTTLDTANRLARFAWSEMFDFLADKNPGAYKLLTNRWVASAISIILGGVMAVQTIGGIPAWRIVWPAFAGTNQLLAALALMTSALWVYTVLRVRGALAATVLAPSIFLWVTVTAALAWWIVVILPHIPPVYQVGAGSVAVISFLLDLYLFYAFVRRMTSAAREVRVEAREASRS